MGASKLISWWKRSQWKISFS